MAFQKRIFLLALSLALTPSGSGASPGYQEQQFVLARGEVNKPGMIQFTDGMTVRHAVILFEGMTAIADVSRVMVLGNDRRHITVDVLAMDGTNEVELHAGDVIAVPSIGKKQFFAMGEINTPGVFDWREGLTLRDAAILFKGTTFKASLARTFIVRKPTDGGRQIVIPVNIGAVMRGEIEDMPILPDDIIFIEEFGKASKP